jgi:hypothetical protein
MLTFVGAGADADADADADAGAGADTDVGVNVFFNRPHNFFDSFFLFSNLPPLISICCSFFVCGLRKNVGQSGLELGVDVDVDVNVDVNVDVGVEIVFD